jgi:O-antigen ligase
MSNLLKRPQLAAATAILVGLLAGAVAERRPSMAVLLALCLFALACLAVLGDRAFPWAIVLVAVLPWYPLVAHEATAPVVKQKILCAAIAAAVLVPWLWSLARGGRRTKPSRRALLLGVLFASFAVVIYQTLGSVSKMIDSQIVGFLLLGVTFLCARRFADPRAWLAPAFAGVVVLALIGFDAYHASPGNRIGYFAGYPITYGALMVGLLPAALVFAYRRSRLLAGALVAAGGALLILSESRSSWVAVAVLLIVVILLQARRGNMRALAGVLASALIVGGLILSTESLHKIVEQKLSSKLTSTQSYTHRAWSYGYAVKQIGSEPLLGAGAPGFSASEAANRTSIGAIDNGYLSISVDMGLVGLLAALIPLLVALYFVARCMYFALAPPMELALALGVIGMGVVTIFYDSFYWAQIDLLLGAMGGVLSVRLAALGPARNPAKAPVGHSPARRLLASRA